MRHANFAHTPDVVFTIALSSKKMDKLRRQLYKLSSNTDLNSPHGVEICIVPRSIVLKETTICAIPDSNEKGFCVGAKRHARYLAKEIDLLLLVKPTLCIIDMHKVSWLSHCHELPIRCETDGSNSSQVTLEHSNRL